MSLPDFACPDFQRMVPSWWSNEPLEAPVPDQSVEGGGGAPKSVVPEWDRVFMPRALQIYGLQHLTNNLVSDMHTSLSYWQTFWSQLKVFE
eukprot:6326280-Alexandrium_andersonii.AAC.1